MLEGEFAAVPFVRLVFNKPSVEEVLAEWTSITDDEVLGFVDHATGATLLFYAVQRRPDSEALLLTRYLVQERAVCKVTVRDANLQTPLFFAARDGNTSTVDFLIQSGCDASARDNAGQTALFYASREGHTEVIRMLIAAGAEVNCTDKIGQSALFYAAREGQRLAVEKLLEQGADPRIRDWSKKCAHSYALKRGHNGVAALLKTRCGDPVLESASSSRRSTQGNFGGSKRKAAPHSAGLNAFPAQLNQQKVLLQCRISTSSEHSEWIFPTLALIDEFEHCFPNIAAWSRVHTPVYEPMDGFRIEWARKCLDLVSVIGNYKDAVWFQKPVDVKALHCPDYYQVVKQPRDLSMIKKKLKDLNYNSIATFKEDMELLWKNCFLYNPSTSRVYKAGEKLKDVFEQVWSERNMAEYIKRENLLIQRLKAESLDDAVTGMAEADDSMSLQADSHNHHLHGRHDHRHQHHPQAMEDSDEVDGSQAVEALNQDGDNVFETPKTSAAAAA